MLRRASTTSIWPLGEGAQGRQFAIANEASGQVFLADAATAALVDRLDGDTALEHAASGAGIGAADLEDVLTRLLRHGLVTAPGQTQRTPQPRRPVEARLLFWRMDLLDIGPTARAVAPVMAGLFAPLGVALWSMIVAVALVGLAAEREVVLAALAALPALGWREALGMLLAFALLKAVHELGHAVALIRAAAGEGVPLGPIRAGIAFFALVPFPYTDATAAWKLRSRWRRAGVGLAGVFVESWIAAAVAILMLQIAPGPLQTFLAQILVVAGLSTLLFNLNPLVRLDGYYVLCDLARQPNLATRATLAARETALGLLGADRADERRGDGRGPGFIAYWLLSYAYRWVIFAGIFWLAYGIDPRLTWGVGAVALSLLV
ncbi:MAG: hypothetical protein AAFV86_24040, partial [Pseudomonadota bacterium]